MHIIGKIEIDLIQSQGKWANAIFIPNFCNVTYGYSVESTVTDKEVI